MNHINRDKMIRNKEKTMPPNEVEHNDPEKMLINSESKIIIRNIIDQLPAREKMLILMYQDGFSYKELSGATGIAFSSVGKTLWRTIDLISDKLKKIENG
jgi:RNA polymerase sigma factor (sigma-70 family)